MPESIFPRTRRRSLTNSMPATLSTVLNENGPTGYVGGGGSEPANWFYNVIQNSTNTTVDEQPNQDEANDTRRPRSSSLNSHHLSGINTNSGNNSAEEGGNNSVTDSDDEDVTTLILRLGSLRNLIVAYYQQSSNREVF